ncbi:NGG1p interacting factor NIF3 [Acinetobacter rudis]|uniref:NGG1p interacting factor NIF3 n=1 Tax=Acinetobacter rudis TaxID=632955 RepID=A0AAW8JDB5_9GAMM|nr:NGG1p interacting factor NIF3 [Acinetobacter rudis]MDQ8935664.1 NGG1p interacting factor NIF3 [Acinetobacter rudis]MDQ8952065.1 NGG1p interacting factor NIF3 [Acinetobacter rudis]MDQ9017927.1 NGG1p interacting factor NIF3 [Acinetobacter rudis]
MLKLVYYVPESHLEQTKTAIFTAGAGRFNGYEHCAWQVLGMGQFKPMMGAQPFIGQPGVLEKVPEWRVELVLEESCAKAVLAALKTSHPYEVPAYEFSQLIEV